MPKLAALLLFTFALAATAQQPATLKPADNLVIENIPPIPASVSEQTARYGESRAALVYDWHPTRREMLIGTRFGDTAQVHSVAMPGGARRQLTFYPDRVTGATYLPGGDAFLFNKDSGGGEWYQIYRYNVADGAVTLLTDGESRNSAPLVAHHSSRFIYSITRRGSGNSELWTMDAADAQKAKESAHKLLTTEGAGWQPVAWSPDNSHLLVIQSISINESYLWLVDATTGEKQLLTPKQAGEPIAYSDAVFAADGRGLWVVTDRESEFERLAYLPLAGSVLGDARYVTANIPWDVEAISLSEDGKTLAFATNENGISKLYVLDTVTNKVRPLPSVPTGVITGLRLHPDGHDLAFSISSARSPLDAYSIDTRTGKLERWTESETGGLNPATFIEPKLVTWKSFDNREISGFLYSPDPAKFPGKRPVMLDIHGGPEGQARPTYLGQQNYILNELGVAILAPNVRGSTGYGKSFLKLDNGFHRDDTYKDINAMLDWVAAQPLLDATRVMAYGGSYGGHMTWAIAAFYNDRIRCALPIVGMSNLVTFLEHTEAYRRDLRRVEYGDERDPAMRAYLEKIAPMNHLDAMHKPIFAVVGKNDPRVPWTESRQILDKLNAQGTPTWFLMANDEGHGYAKKKNRDYLFNAEVLFMNRYLLDGMRPATAGGQ
jgi:dipeptidyl aminopeptidase/acylaminoacyl peptidase